MTTAVKHIEKLNDMKGVVQVHAAPDIFVVKVPLRRGTIKYLNSYIVQSDGDTLIVDVGHDYPEGREAVRDALYVLDADLSRTSVFVTHFHDDHAEALPTLLPSRCTRYAGAQEIEFYQEWFKTFRYDVRRRCREEGMTPKFTDAIDPTNWVCDFSAEFASSLVPLSEGDKIRVGAYDFECLMTNGHTPGHMSLFERSTGTLIVGDTLMFDLAPNLHPWHYRDSVIEQQLTSLRKIKSLEVESIFVGHGANHPANEIPARVDEVIAHHEKNFEKFLSAIRENPGRTGSDLTRIMSKDHGIVNFDSIDEYSKYYVLGSNMAHLDYICEKGWAVPRYENGLVVYYISDEADPLAL